jgi:hypothetical protein
VRWLLLLLQPAQLLPLQGTPRSCRCCLRLHHLPPLLLRL